MSSVLEEIRSAAQARLAELEPLVMEARQLSELLSTLDERERGAGAADGAAPQLQLASPHDSGHSRGLRHSARAPQGANKRLILGIIGGRPGIAAPEIAALTGLKRTVVASTISRLKRTGELEACGAGVQLPGAPAAHVAA